MKDHLRGEPREPSVLHTAMRISRPEHLERLKLKLVEYRQRAEERTGWVEYDHPDYQLLLFGKELFKEPILDYVVEAASARDTTIDPIVITEVAVAVTEVTGYDVTRAVTIPFQFNEDGRVYEPDYRRLSLEATLADDAFSEACAIIMGYANDEPWGIEGGTGLPGTSS